MCVNVEGGGTYHQFPLTISITTIDKVYSAVILNMHGYKKVISVMANNSSMLRYSRSLARLGTGKLVKFIEYLGHR